MIKSKLPKIGLKLWNIFIDYNYSSNFDTLELALNLKDFFILNKIIKLKEYFCGKELSLHSRTSRIFSNNKYKAKIPFFDDIEMLFLKAEIKVSRIIGAKELIFHLKQEKLDEKEKIKLAEILCFAEKNNVEMIYESNHKFYSKTCLDVLNSFPRLNYNLDLGHLNTSIGCKTLGMDLNNFLDKIKSRVVYIHAHNNNGINDEHKSLDKGTLDWREVLNRLNIFKARKIIIEIKTKEDILNTKRLLEDYLRKREKNETRGKTSTKRV